MPPVTMTYIGFVMVDPSVLPLDVVLPPLTKFWNAVATLNICGTLVNVLVAAVSAVPKFSVSLAVCHVAEDSVVNPWFSDVRSMVLSVALVWLASAWLLAIAVAVM